MSDKVLSTLSVRSKVHMICLLPADVIATPFSVALLKFRKVYLSVAILPGNPENSH